VDIVNDKVVRNCLTYLSVQKWIARNVLYYVKLWPKLTLPLKNANFQSIFARSASGVTVSEKYSIITNSKFTTGFPMNLK